MIKPLAIELLILLHCYNVQAADLGTPMQKICSPNKGGMFGYSISLSNGLLPPNKTADSSNRWSYLAISQPWDATVHIYASLKEQASYEVINSTVNYTFVPPDPVRWTFIQSLSDTGNGTWPLRSHSLFGYSVSISEDGVWLAVGIPGRTYASASTIIALQYHTFAGAVMVYKLSGQASTGSGGYSGPLYSLIKQITNPSTQIDLFWQKFGSKVLIRSVGPSAYRLIVGSNAGWDGASTKYFSARPGNPQWPIEPTNVKGAGIYVFEMGTQASGLDYVGLVQSVMQKSPQPLGSIGQDFDMIVSSEDDGSEYHLFMRDFVVPPLLVREFAQACPSLNCSYATVMLDSKPYQINSTGAVVHYTKWKNGTFTERQILTPNDFAGYGPQPTSWENHEWFGIGISVSHDPRYNRYILAVGAPRNSRQLHMYHSETIDNWKAGALVPNESDNLRSFFGQKVNINPRGQFMIVSDPVDGNSKVGGKVRVYHRRSNYDFLPEFTGVVSAPIAFAIAFENLGSYSNNGTLIGDQFGFGLATNENLFAVGSHVADCVSIYRQPALVEIVMPPPSPPKPIIPNTIQPRPTEVPEEVATVKRRKGYTVGLIAGLLGLFCGIAVFYAMYRLHKAKVMKNLQMERKLNGTSDEPSNRLGSEDPSAANSSEPLDPSSNN